MNKELYTTDDVLELLSELAIGSEDVKKIETFLQRRESHLQWQRSRLDEACRMIGSNLLDEVMMYE